MATEKQTVKQKIRESKKLLLFDIDGTLLYSNGNGKRAILSAIEKVFGKIDLDSSLSMAGKTDRLILSELLSPFYATEVLEKKLDELVYHYLEFLSQYFQPENGVGVYSGVPELLEILQGSSECVVGLLTGNISEGAKVKLSAFDLNRYFKLGAFGDDGFYRNELPSVAVSRANSLTGQDFSGKDIVIIGDTVNDVECGRHLGVRSVAICSNLSTEKELQASNPDFFFYDFNNRQDILAALLG